MKMPNYIKDLMSRAKYNFSLTSNPNYAVGYTVNISKRTEYQTAGTFRDEIVKLRDWVKRNNAECEIISVPVLTRYSNQTAIVTIYDPVMQYLQDYIPDED